MSRAYDDYLRDKLIHAYFVVDLMHVWETVKRDLPALRETVSQMLADLETKELGGKEDAED